MANKKQTKTYQAYMLVKMWVGVDLNAKNFTDAIEEAKHVHEDNYYHVDGEIIDKTERLVGVIENDIEVD